MIKLALKSLLKLCYRVEVTGTENFPKDDNILIVANHLSFLDAILLATFLPIKPTFAVNTHIAGKWWMKPALKVIKTFPLDPTNPMATKSMISHIKDGNPCVIFPEGRITVTGSLMKIYEGPGLIADKSNAAIVPVRIDGAQYTPFSRLKGKVRISLFPKITMHILPVAVFNIPEEIKGRSCRHQAGQKLYNLMSEMLFTSTNIKETLFQSLINAQKIHGGNHKIVEDIERKPLTYNSLIMRSFLLGKYLTRDNKEGERTGLLLPNSSAAIQTFFALQAYGNTPAMLNYSTGEKNIISTCKTANLQIVITSKRFITLTKSESLVESLTNENITIIYLEEIKPFITTKDKLVAFFQTAFPSIAYNKTHKEQSSENPAVILFTSGSEGSPKGVVLSHENLQANRHQLASRVDFGSTDIVFNALPIFHSFGLTGATLLPILGGMKTFFYPSPLHYRIVPELVYDTNATILFGTDTFLSGYARFAHPYDFYAIRYVFAGAERLKPQTKEIWNNKYGVRIFEGYGATETSPAISTNTPMHNKAGTVGRILPGITYKLETIDGYDVGKRLHVSGPNIMQGYLLASDPGNITAKNEWYDTGDIVDIDDEGYVTIKGRAKRFAKIAGEMISLSAVESYIKNVWDENDHAVCNIPDEKKGEKIILLTTRKKAKRIDLTNHTKSNGLSELYIPKTIIEVDNIPLLGTGKVDYVTVTEIAIKNEKA